MSRLRLLFPIGALLAVGALFLFRSVIFSLLISGAVRFSLGGELSYTQLEREEGALLYTDFSWEGSAGKMQAPSLRIEYGFKRQPWRLILQVVSAHLSFEKGEGEGGAVPPLLAHKRFSVLFAVDDGIYQTGSVSLPFSLFSPEEGSLSLRIAKGEGECRSQFQLGEEGLIASVAFQKCKAPFLTDLGKAFAPQWEGKWNLAQGEVDGELIWEKQKQLQAGRVHLQMKGVHLYDLTNETEYAFSGELAAYLPLSADPIHSVIGQLSWEEGEVRFGKEKLLLETRGSIDYAKRWSLSASGKWQAERFELIGKGILAPGEEQLLSFSSGLQELLLTGKWDEQEARISAQEFDLALLSPFFPKLPGGVVSGSGVLLGGKSLLFSMSDVEWHAEKENSLIQEAQFSLSGEWEEGKLFFHSLDAGGRAMLPFFSSPLPFSIAIAADQISLLETPFLNLYGQKNGFRVGGALGIEGSLSFAPAEQTLFFALQRGEDRFEGLVEQLVLDDLSIRNLSSLLLSGEERGRASLFLSDLTSLKPVLCSHLPFNDVAGALRLSAFFERGVLEGTYSLTDFFLAHPLFSCRFEGFDRGGQSEFFYDANSGEASVSAALCDALVTVQGRRFSHVDAAILLDQKGLHLSSISLADPALQARGKGNLHFSPLKGNIEISQMSVVPSSFFPGKFSFVTKGEVSGVQLAFTDKSLELLSKGSAAKFQLASGEEIKGIFASDGEKWGLGELSGKVAGFSPENSSLFYFPKKEKALFAVGVKRGEKSWCRLHGKIDSLLSKEWKLSLDSKSTFFSRPLSLTSFRGGIGGVEEASFAGSVRLEEVAKELLLFGEQKELAALLEKNPLSGEVSLGLSVSGEKLSLVANGKKVRFGAKREDSLQVNLRREEGQMWILDRLQYGDLSLEGVVQKKKDILQWIGWRGQTKEHELLFWGNFDLKALQFSFDLHHKGRYKAPLLFSSEERGVISGVCEKDFSLRDLRAEFSLSASNEHVRIEKAEKSKARYKKGEGIFLEGQTLFGYAKQGVRPLFTLAIPSVILDPKSLGVHVDEIILQTTEEKLSPNEKFNSPLLETLFQQIGKVELSCDIAPNFGKKTVFGQITPRKKEEKPWILLETFGIASQENSSKLFVDMTLGQKPLRLDLSKAALLILDRQTKEKLELSFVTSTLRGSFEGIQIDAHASTGSDEKTAWYTVRGDFSRIYRLFPKKKQSQIVSLGLGKGIDLSGKVLLGKKTPLHFEGKVRGANFPFFGRHWGRAEAQMSGGLTSFRIDNFEVVDPALQLSVKQIVAKKGKEGWVCHIPLLALSDLSPAVLKGNDEVFRLRNLTFTDLSGKLADYRTFTGKGFLSFTNSREKSFWDIPRELTKTLGLDPSLLTPIVGEADLELEKGKVYLRSLENSYSEGKRSRFFLSKERPSYFDLEGNLSIDLQMKQKVLLKVTELFTVAVRGKMNKPEFSLR